MKRIEDVQESTHLIPSPEGLIRAFQQGDEAAFHELYERFKCPIFFFIKAMTGGQNELSEELAHESFLKLYKHADQFNFEVKFTTWFWTIARNLTIDELRKKNPLNWSYSTSQNEVPLVEELPTENLEIEVIYLEKVNREQLYQAIEKLKPRQREAILLRIASELSFEEIGQVLKLKPNAVKALYSRAKANLIKTIEASENKETKKELKVAT